MKIFRRFDKEECTKQTVVICSLAIMLLVVFVLSPNESYACTGFIADNDAVVLVGNNEDWPEPCSMVWFLPHEKGKYGRMYFGFSSGGPPFGGMNDQGLFFDKFGLARKPVQTSEQRKDGRADLILRIMETCATVEEALQVLKQYNLKFLERVQLMLADKTGDAAIIEDAEVIHRKQGKYQVVTNFRLSEIQPQDTIHWRYKKANSLLQKKPVSFESFRDILDAVHLEDRRWPTQYSNIYDLKNGVVYVYHFHDFQRKVVFNLYEELRKGKHSYELPSLFPDTVKKQFYLQYYQETSNNPFESLPMVVFIIVCALVFLSAILVWPLHYVINLINAKRKNQSDVKITSRPEGFTWFFASLTSFFLLIAIALTVHYPILFAWGLPSLDELTISQKMAILTPLLGVTFSIFSIISGIWAWKKSWWTLKSRIHYTVISLVALVYCIFLYYYGLLTISF